MRLTREEYFIQIAKAIAKMSPRTIKSGVVAVKNNGIIATAYNTENICAIMSLICQCVKAGISLKDTTIYTNAIGVHEECNKYLKEIGAKIILLHRRKQEVG